MRQSHACSEPRLARTLRLAAVLTVVIIVPITRRFVISRSLLLMPPPRCSNVGSLRRGNKKRIVRYTLMPTSYEVSGMVITRLMPIMQNLSLISSSRNTNDKTATMMYPPIYIRYLIPGDVVFTDYHCHIEKPHFILESSN
jgi:hypothetical protein